jgi:hypothetical protein
MLKRSCGGDATGLVLPPNFPCFPANLCASHAMRFVDSLSILWDMFAAFRFGMFPTLHDVLHSPGLLLSPRELRRVFMAHLWVPFSQGIDENSKTIKEALITPNAHGTVLDIGAGQPRALRAGREYIGS